MQREKEELRKVEEANYASFRDCLSTPLIEKSSTKASKKGKRVRGNRIGRKTAIKPVVRVEKEDEDDATELAEFVDVGTLMLPKKLFERGETGS